MVLGVALCLLGFLLLYYGAEWLVRGSSSLARSLGVSRIVIGLTVVAFGTSMPELVVSAIASFKGNSMIAVGNAVGSNICNIALILGLAAVFQPLTCHRSVITRDIPIMIGLSLVTLVLTLDSRLGRSMAASSSRGLSRTPYSTIARRSGRPMERPPAGSRPSKTRTKAQTS